MQPTSNPQNLLQQIAAISRMERGKLSVIRNGPKGAYYNLQRREAGRNVTEYVPQDQVTLVQENIESHKNFETLVEEYERFVTEQTREERKAGGKKKTADPNISIAQEAEIQDLIAAFRSKEPTGTAVAELETLVRAAIFKPANELVGMLLQQAADRFDAAYSPKPGEQKKGREPLMVQCMFGSFLLMRQYYYHPGKKSGHCPADAALGIEVAYTPALARLICLEGGGQSSFLQGSNHLREVGGIDVCERQIQRVVARVGESAMAWQKRESAPGPCDAEILYISADATGVPMRREELAGAKGKAPNGKAKTRMAMLGCVFTQHTEDEEGRPMRDHESTTYLSGFLSPSDFGIGLRREAIRRGLFSAREIVLLVDGGPGLEKLGRDYFADAIQIVDFYHAMEHLQILIEILWDIKDGAHLR